MISKKIKVNHRFNGKESIVRYYSNIHSIVQRLLSTCDKDHSFNLSDFVPAPSIEKIIEIIQLTRSILFPGYFYHKKISTINLEYHLEQKTTALLDLLSEQIVLATQHDCLGYERPCSLCTEKGHETSSKFIQFLPKLRTILSADIRAAMDGDPAAKSYDEIIMSYPGLFAITVYRMAHNLHEMKVALLPRMMTEYAHSLTGIDIHPGAEIGESFFIDHGTGVVVGETTEIGDRVRIYQGVTLGALSLPKNETNRYRNKKRHPTIEDDVIIYSNATILGEEAVIGARSIIGGNVWITERVPPDTKVVLKRPERVYIGKIRNPLQNMA